MSLLLLRTLPGLSPGCSATLMLQHDRLGLIGACLSSLRIRAGGLEAPPSTHHRVEKRQPLLIIDIDKRQNYDVIFGDADGVWGDQQCVGSTTVQSIARVCEVLARAYRMQ